MSVYMCGPGVSDERFQSVGLLLWVIKHFWLLNKWILRLLQFKSIILICYCGSQKRNFKKPRLKTFFAILYSNRFSQKVLRELGLFRPAENLSTLFLFNAIQFDSDISTQDQHLLNDIKKWKEYKPHFPPLTLHILSLSKLMDWSTLPPWTQMSSHQKPRVKLDPRVTCTSSYLHAHTNVSSH